MANARLNYTSNLNNPTLFNKLQNIIKNFFWELWSVLIDPSIRVQFRNREGTIGRECRKSISCDVMLNKVIRLLAIKKFVFIRYCYTLTVLREFLIMCYFHIFKLFYFKICFIPVLNYKYLVVSNTVSSRKRNVFLFCPSLILYSIKCK